MSLICTITKASSRKFEQKIEFKDAGELLDWIFKQNSPVIVSTDDSSGEVVCGLQLYDAPVD